MSGISEHFCKQLGAEIATALGSDFKFYKSRLELRRDSLHGSDVVVLAPSAKFSPQINLSFYFGRNFAIAKRIEKSVGYHQFYYHIQQFSLNRQPLYATSYNGPDNWDIDLTNPPANLCSEITNAIKAMAESFFARFASAEAARDAIASDDSWCLGGPTYWRQLLLLDLALDDLGHFKQWYLQLDDWTQNQANQEMARHAALR